MVLNLMILKIAPFLPGLFWIKKRFPRLLIDNNDVIIKNIGINNSSRNAASIKSDNGFIAALYMNKMLLGKSICQGQRIHCLVV